MADYLPNNLGTTSELSSGVDEAARLAKDRITMAKYFLIVFFLICFWRGVWELLDKISEKSGLKGVWNGVVSAGLGLVGLYFIFVHARFVDKLELGLL